MRYNSVRFAQQHSEQCRWRTQRSCDARVVRLLVQARSLQMQRTGKRKLCAVLTRCRAERAGMFGFFFSEHPIKCFEDAAKYGNAERFGKYHRLMLEHGVYTAPSMYEAGFTSLAHTDAQIDKTLEAFDSVFAQL
jgi:glutamate-1-semialdehyde aminotransferase